MRAVYRPQDPPGLDYSRLEYGMVISQQPGTNRVDVRLQGAHQRIIRNVLVPKGAVFESDDMILIARVRGVSSWIGITRLDRMDEFGLSVSKTARRYEIHPPSGYVLEGYPGGVLARWDAWPGGPICFELQFNTRPSTVGAANRTTFGSQYIYVVETDGKVYGRIRSLRFDPETGNGYRSGWTPWVRVIPVPSGREIIIKMDRMLGIIERWIAGILTGEL